jgi:hypothetical protein
VRNGVFVWLQDERSFLLASKVAAWDRLRWTGEIGFRNFDKNKKIPRPR